MVITIESKLIKFSKDPTRQTFFQFDRQEKMLRFLSRRKNRNANDGVGGGGTANTANSHIKSERIPVNKNKIDCRVILLDSTDLSIELSVSTTRIAIDIKSPFNWICSYVFLFSPFLFIEKSTGQLSLWASVLRPRFDWEGILWFAVHWCEPC